ncbi:tetratricopeptide repeat protein [Pelomyxa schiedti]|nr:tetratricopeptide repeat protein [Pelomyxa schiedti]
MRKNAREEWNELLSVASANVSCTIVDATMNHQEERHSSWSCTYFVALWMTFCMQQVSCDKTLILTEHSEDVPEGSPQPPALLRYACMTLLGALCWSGTGGERREAISLWESAATQGDTTAMCELAYCYEHGKSVDKYTTRAASWSAFNLGYCFFNGQGVDKDVARAVELHKLAADDGQPAAMYELAECYSFGTSVGQDFHKAAVLHQEALDAGYIRSAAPLGVCYFDGEGVERDVTRAAALFERGANAGIPVASHYLAECYLHGDGVVQDFNKEAVLYQRALDTGFTPSALGLSGCYYTGRGVAKDTKKAFEILYRGAVGGEMIAQYALGRLYQFGEGVGTVDIRTAAKFFRLAAAENSPEAQEQAKKGEEGRGPGDSSIKGLMEEKGSLMEVLANTSDPVAHALLFHLESSILGTGSTCNGWALPPKCQLVKVEYPIVKESKVRSKSDGTLFHFHHLDTAE